MSSLGIDISTKNDYILSKEVNMNKTICCPGYWINRYGKVYNIKEISNSYLKNIINFLKRELKFGEYNLIDTIAIRNKIDELEQEMLNRGIL